jgi:hypothetical protein
LMMRQVMERAERIDILLKRWRCQRSCGWHKSSEAPCRLPRLRSEGVAAARQLGELIESGDLL